MNLWSQVNDPDLLNTYQSLPIQVLGNERWFAGQVSADQLSIEATFQFQSVVDKNRYLTLNLYSSETPSRYFYYIPLLITSGPVQGQQPFYSNANYWVYDGIPTTEYIDLVENLLLKKHIVTLPDSKQALSFSVSNHFGKYDIEMLGCSSNTMLVLSKSMMLKNYRRVFPGANPELRIGMALTRLGSTLIPKVLGSFTYYPDLSCLENQYTLGIVQEKLEHQGTGWAIWEPLIQSELPREIAETVLQANTLGEVVAQLHQEMAMVAQEEKRWTIFTMAMIQARIAKVGELVAAQLAPTQPEFAQRVMERLQAIVADLDTQEEFGKAFRIHGDLHLEQVLQTKTGWKVIDFEGEPLKTIEEREYYDSPLKDLASLMRSISYRVNTLESVGAAEVEHLLQDGLLQGYYKVYQEYCEAFLPEEPERSRLLELFELERVIYEFVYESHYRPDWVKIPLSGLDKLLAETKEAVR